MIGRRACGAVMVATLSIVWVGAGTAASASRAAVPSKQAKMICAGEAKHDIAGVLAIKPVRVTKPTWVDDVYSCTYVYPTGSFTVAVKDLPDRTATSAYFDTLGTTLSRLPDAVGLGDGAFLTPTGSVVVRKDNKVLEVDASKLPAEFGKLELSPADVGSTVAMTILGCWTG
jgi:hypothetical protein